jgi:hypothetical protein
MRLSTSLHKNILESSVGFLMNKFKARGRRVTLFPEDILAEYIRRCEDSGLGGRVFDVTMRWTDLIYQSVLPPLIRKLPPEMLVNIIMKKVWTTLGGVEDIRLSLGQDCLELRVKNDIITRLIGPTKCSAAVYNGTLSNVLNKNLRLKRLEFDGVWTRYSFELAGQKRARGEKKIKRYKSTALDGIRGIDLNYALRMGILTLGERNTIYFRGRPLIFVENTIFHLLAAENILLDAIAGISFAYFEGLVEKSAPVEKKLLLLKTLIQVMGWGIPKIVWDGRAIQVKIFNAPSGVQIEKDNYLFFVKTIEGYLKTINCNFSLDKVEEAEREFSATFALKA